MLDESTDNGLEFHLIVYVTYLQCGGCGPKQTEYMGLLKISMVKVELYMNMLSIY